jgi:hypothetical protein
MSKKDSKKNIEKLKIFLAKQQQDDVKTSNKKVGGNSVSTSTN